MSLSIARFPYGTYTIRPARGGTPDENFVTAVPKDGEGGYNLQVSKYSRHSNWIIRDVDDVMFYSVIPAVDVKCACTGLTAKNLNAIPSGEAAQFQRVWAFNGTSQAGVYTIWRLSEVEGKLDYWRWDGNPSSPLTLSHELGSDTSFIIEKIA